MKHTVRTWRSRGEPRAGLSKKSGIKGFVVMLVIFALMLMTACGADGDGGADAPRPDTDRGSDNRADEGGSGRVTNVGRVMQLPNLFSAEEADDYAEAAEASRAFAVDWFTAVLEDSEDDNAVVSPYSAAMALSMTLRGANGVTYDEIAEALHVAGLDESDYLRQQAILIRHLMDRHEDVKLSVANSIWHAESMQAADDYLEQMREYYGAEIAGVNFQDPETPKLINDWVAEQTMGKIDSIVPEPIEDAPFMYLINALYLQSPWYEPFNKDHTAEEPFKLANGETVQVPMMKKNGSMQAIDADAYTGVRLPLGDEADLNMILILPDEGTSWEEIKPDIANMDMRHSFSTYAVELALPKFRIEQKLDLIPSFRALEMETLFDEAESDLNRMAGWDTETGPRLFIDEALQKTYIEIDEEGLEAAAVTSMRAYPTSMPEKLPAVFDRPFYFLIEEPESGVVLFIGAVGDPR